MADWRTWKKGRKTTWHWNEFDGSGSREGIITEVHEDHAIMEADGMHLWIDDDTAEIDVQLRKTGRETSPDKHINPPVQGADDRVL